MPGPAIALIDYGAGNLTSVRKGFAAAGADLYTASTPADLSRAAAIVVPGVGHFAATAALSTEWMRQIRTALGNGAILLGICLGLQWLFEGSDEAPGTPGLGLLPGRCTRLPPMHKVPHVGWNSLELTGASPLFDGIPDGTQMYFTHTYAAPVTDACIATTTHGVTFAAAVGTPAAAGVQFHPEKSGRPGLRVLQNFVALAEGR